jgi:predicted ArsR family transcriptional regulator
MARRGHVIGDQAVAEAEDSPSDAALLAATRSVLDGEGYDTRADPDGLILANCPFGALTAVHTEVICGMNQSIMEGLLDRLGQLRLTATCEPAEGRCCIRLSWGFRVLLNEITQTPPAAGTQTTSESATTGRLVT